MIEISFTTIFVATLGILLLLAARIPVAGVLFGVGLIGITIVADFRTAAVVLKTVPYSFASSWSLSALPMYLLMGYLAFECGMAERIYYLVRLTLHKVPGAIAVTTTFACAGFGAISGSAGATTATFGKLAIPEMLRDNYDKGLAAGCVAAAGTMGSLMPPSILMIIYASLVETSVAQVFIAGVLPCLLSAAIYAAMIIIRVKLKPSLAPMSLNIKATSKDVLRGFGSLWDAYVLIFIVFGGIYSGFVTPTEAGGLSAFAALVIGLTTRRLNWEKIKHSFFEAMKVTGYVLIIGVGASIFTRFLALAGVHEYLEQSLGGLSQIGFMGLIFLVFVVLGMFLDPIGMMLLTIPVLTPIFAALDISLVWFGVLMIKAMELGNITPPVGLGVYIIKGVVGNTIPLETIFKGILWFALMDMITFWILVLFPGISLLLPQFFYGL